MSKEKPFFHHQYPSDSTGCWAYRMLFPKLCVQSVVKNINFSESRRFVVDVKYYQGMNSVEVQRQVSDPQHNFFMNYLIPLSKSLGFNVIYNVDDCIWKDSIPRYNSAHDSYQSDKNMKNITDMIQSTDFLVVTTEYLKQNYIKRFGADTDSTIVIPNFLPHWWMGHCYDVTKSMLAYDKYIRRPRLGVIASSTHYDVKNNNNGVDDFTHIIPFIKDTCKKYEWVFVGTVPQQLVPMVQSGDITVVKGSNIMNYPDVIKNLNCQAIIQPLIDNEFNRCKSNLKFLESCAIGTPLIAQNINIYQPHTDLLFDDSNGLQNKIDHVLKNRSQFRSFVRGGKNELDHGRYGKGWWLENNIEQWLQLYRMTGKCIDIDVNKIIESEQAKKLEIVR